jgi:hypothetical protein
MAQRIAFSPQILIRLSHETISAQSLPCDIIQRR